MLAISQESWLTKHVQVTRGSYVTPKRIHPLVELKVNTR